MEKMSTSSPGGTSFSRGGWVILNFLIYLALGLVFALAPIYEVTVEGEPTRYTFFFEAYRVIEGNDAIAFLVLTGVGLGLIAAACVFQVIAFAKLLRQNGDSSDKCFVVGAILFTLACMGFGVSGMTHDFVVLLLIGLAFGLLGFGSILLHFKKFAELSNA
ncbi:MAG: hypothetical protein SPG64_05905 [Candidatus Enteromonas sp.]|nr:hypothetical protein [Candidatus Enteromonas sp.]